MIPLRLRLRNFMCYRDPDTLDLTGVHLACLAGDNGHGKSALLDAMTWALWGRARARSDDELVTIGQEEMEVEFEFVSSGTHYRVIRKRQLGRPSKSALELQVKDGSGFRVFTAPTQRETQARLNDILRLDYETFVNSALLLQGRADEFTVKAAGERKRILADILGLSVYDGYEARAKELAKEKEQAEREVGARIQEIERELDHWPEYERELAAAQTELRQIASEARAAEAILQELRDRMKALEGQRLQLDQVSKRVQNAEAQLRELDERLDLINRQIAQCESVLQRRAEIEIGYRQLLRLREEDAQYNAKLGRLVTLNEERAEAERQVMAERQKLELQIRVLEGRVAELRKLVEQRSTLEADRVRVSAELEQLNALQAQNEQDKERIKALSNEAAGLTTLNAQLKMDLVALQEKTAMLRKPTAACPVCGQSLSENDRLRLLEEFEQKRGEEGERYRANASRLKEIEALVKSASTEIERRERELRRLPALQGRAATLDRALQEAERASAELQEQEKMVLSLQQRLARRGFAADEQAKLAALQERIAELQYDKASHEEIRQALARLASIESEKAQLDSAQQAATQLQSNRQQLLRDREQWVAVLDVERQRQSELAEALEGWEELALDLKVKARQVDELRSREARALQVVGAVQQKLDYCQYLARERQDRTKQLRTITEERLLYEELQLAFGKKGLQALVIETAIPELEEEANALLGRMTDGRMNVRFETQRDTKAGSTLETLDIRIADENGVRSYEMYSGGEAFRINFAIRIALSRLLARRAGAQLQTLLIDEGFGSQDADGRQKLVEAINSIKDDFSCILVITHIDELKDAFPVRIDVYKTAQGSQIAIR